MDKTSQTRMLDLLDHAYRVSDDLDAFEALLENANSYFFDEADTVQISPHLPRFADMDPHIDRHIERLGRFIATRKGEDKLGLSLDRHAQFILSAKGRVISANAEAIALAPGVEGAFLNDLPFSLDSIDALRELTREILAGVQSLDRIIHMQIETEEPTPAFGFCRAVDLRDPAKGGGAVGLRVSLSYFSWSPAIFESLTNALGLTGSEGEVLRGVLLGHSQKDIADSRGRSLDTIKSQSKSILRKAGCSRMTDLAHLCTSIAYVIGLSEKAAKEGAINEQWITPQQNMYTMERPNGRTLAWYEYGDPDGRPVLYFHGFFQGPFFLDSMKRKFLEAGLRVIAPSRPSFGYSSAPDAKTPYPAMVKEDVLALLDAVAPQGDILVVASHGGSNHGYRAVDALGERVKAMVMIGARVPITREHLAHMQQRARTISAACRHAPSVMKLIVTLGMKTYQERGIKAFLQNEYAPAVIDRADIAYPDRFLKMSEGMFHLMQQGGDAFVRDGGAQMSNWSDVYQRVSVPQFWIHGRYCHVMGAHLLEKYVTNTGGKITIVESAGFNILYQHPSAVMDTINEAVSLFGDPKRD